MCSSTRGPARVPSLVTWPTMITVMPLDLAMWVSCAAHSRTCATEPGADCSASEYIVWIESITATAGFSDFSCAWIFSRLISASRLSAEASSARRFARNAICCADSSPLMYSTLWPSPMAHSACNSSVDLPMPGSPPISTTAPCTSPPPSTRSNSATPVISRLSSCASMSLRRRNLPTPVIALKRLPAAGAVSAMVSTSVFHAVQCGHCPCHLTDWPPHSVQVYIDFGLAMRYPAVVMCRRQRRPARAAAHRIAKSLSATMPIRPEFPCAVCGVAARVPAHARDAGSGCGDVQTA